MPRIETDLPGVSFRWSPVNQAYLVLWHDSVLRVLPSIEAVTEYLESLRRK